MEELRGAVPEEGRYSPPSGTGGFTEQMSSDGVSNPSRSDAVESVDLFSFCKKEEKAVSFLKSLPQKLAPEIEQRRQRVARLTEMTQEAEGLEKTLIEKISYLKIDSQSQLENIE